MHNGVEGSIMSLVQLGNAGREWMNLPRPSINEYCFLSKDHSSIFGKVARSLEWAAEPRNLSTRGSTMNITAKQCFREAKGRGWQFTSKPFGTLTKPTGTSLPLRSYILKLGRLYRVPCCLCIRIRVLIQVPAITQEKLMCSKQHAYTLARSRATNFLVGPGDFTELQLISKL